MMIIKSVFISLFASDNKYCSSDSKSKDHDRQNGDHSNIPSFTSILGLVDCSEVDDAVLVNWLNGSVVAILIKFAILTLVQLGLEEFEVLLGYWVDGAHNVPVDVSGTRWSGD